MCGEIMKYRVYNIEYDTDGEVIDDLPQELCFHVVGQIQIDPEEVLPELVSNHTSWCVTGFDYEEVNEWSEWSVKHSDVHYYGDDEEFKL
jgi:hypothetical protein